MAWKATLAVVVIGDISIFWGVQFAMPFTTSDDMTKKPSYKKYFEEGDFNDQIL